MRTLRVASNNFILTFFFFFSKIKLLAFKAEDESTLRSKVDEVSTFFNGYAGNIIDNVEKGIIAKDL